MKIHFFFIFLIHFTQIKIIMVIGQCNKNDKIKEGSSCFNNIIIFDNGYRAGQFTIRKDGVLLIEYSSGNNRLFYGFKSNGRGFFKNEMKSNEIDIQSDSFIDSEHIVERYESRNKIVYLYNDEFQENPYIFSVSSYIGLNELHYFDDEGNNNHKIWLNLDFFGINEHIYSFQFSLLEFNNNIYYAVYIIARNQEGYGYPYVISKFNFKDSNNQELDSKREFNDNYNNRIISAFIFSDYNYLAVFFLKSSTSKYIMRLHDLNSLENEHEFEIYENNIINPKDGEGIFFKAIYIRNEYVSFIFFQDGNNGRSLILRFLKVEKENDIFSVINYFSKSINIYYFDTSIKTNEFYKIDDKKLLFISTISQKKLILMFYETYLTHKKLNTRAYQFDLEGYYFTKELTVEYYNNFLMFTSTVSVERNPNYDNKLLSILLFFSYPNGTDFYMDIFPYFADSENHSNNNLIQYLLNKCTIDNNIFDYTLSNEIKLISIPNEIIFYNEGNNNPLNNSENANINHILKQNNNLFKDNRIST